MRSYNKKNIPLAKELRKNMTPWERKLWYEFLSTYPIRFQRQKAVGDYIVDFYCAKARLVVELDGGGHYYQEQMDADQRRTKTLEAMGLRVVRICNLDIDRNFRGVCEFIDMEIKRSLPQSAALTAPSSEGASPAGRRIFALGFFDGVHLGHQALLDACKTLAQQTGGIPCAVTFESHPSALITGQAPLLINTVEQRQQILRSYGMEEVMVLPFTRELMYTHWSEFLSLLVECGAAGFVCGHDFRFGARGSGTAKKLAAYCEERNIPWVVVPEQTVDGIRVSSTHIRGLIEAGDMETAEKFLGHPHILGGQVVSGRQLGRTIGVPTANVLIPEGVVVPRLGVYASTCLVDGETYVAVTNIGSRPTVGGHQTRAESWLLDFAGDLYGKNMTVLLHKFLRPEEKFGSLVDLRAQIQRDAQASRELLK